MHGPQAQVSLERALEVSAFDVEVLSCARAGAVPLLGRSVFFCCRVGPSALFLPIPPRPASTCTHSIPINIVLIVGGFSVVFMGLRIIRSFVSIFWWSGLLSCIRGTRSRTVLQTIARWRPATRRPAAITVAARVFSVSVPGTGVMVAAKRRGSFLATTIGVGTRSANAFRTSGRICASRRASSFGP